MPKRLTCNCCLYWQFSPADQTVVPGDRLGHCRRRAPREFRYSDTNKMEGSEWPATKATDWCGEFEQTIEELKQYA